MKQDHKSEYILQTSGLTKQFSGFTAVRDVNLNVKRNTIHALIGPNGAGKTTVYNLLTKFLVPTSGAIAFNGQEVTRTGPADIAGIGRVPPFPISSTFPHLTRINNFR